MSYRTVFLGDHVPADAVLVATEEDAERGRYTHRYACGCVRSGIIIEYAGRYGRSTAYSSGDTTLCPAHAVWQCDD